MTACPDLRPYFPHTVWRPMPHSLEVLVASDWADKADDDPTFGIFKRCGFWTRAEAAVLYDVARQIGGHWLDIGGHTGWTAAHLAHAGCTVVAVDPMYENDEFRTRTRQNLLAAGAGAAVVLYPGTSASLFRDDNTMRISGCVIDGDHTAPIPLQDAREALARLKERGAILLHDHAGAPVQEAAQWLVDQGLQGFEYRTCHGVALCWRGPLRVPVL